MIETREQLQALIKCSLRAAKENPTLRDYFTKQAENQKARLDSLPKAKKKKK